MATPKKPDPTAKIGFEQTLWATADKLRGHMDAAEYKHVVLGLIFLKYISDAFEEKHAQLLAEDNHHEQLRKTRPTTSSRCPMKPAGQSEVTRRTLKIFAVEKPSLTGMSCEF
jgi:type I restriction-modification system DNA methylase subunit